MLKDVRAATLWVAHRYRQFRSQFPRDWEQTVELAILVLQSENGQNVEKESFSRIHHIFYCAMKDYGLIRPLDQLGETDENRPHDTLGDIALRSKAWGNGGRMGFAQGTRLTAVKPCGVSGCEIASVYNDGRLGRLCRRHKSIVNTRRRRGWADPYKDLACARQQGKAKSPCQVPGCGEASEHKDGRYGRICHRHAVMRNNRARDGWADPYRGFEAPAIAHLVTFVPDRNSAFWAKVRLGVSDAEWVAMWLWANGDTPSLADGVLEKAKSAALA